ncbi:MAG: YneF family protein [Bacilli bacterium]|nr:YneF family protein [Bacilli bacterium]
MNWGAFLIDVLQIVGGLIVGLVAGFFLARNYMKKYMKKNPPINEQMIKTMMTQMGRTPSQKQVNQMMKAMSKYTD